LLELFLPECEAVWEGEELTRVKSDMWEEAAGGGTQYLQAMATRTGGCRLIALARLPQELFTYQQLAHDVELAKEKVERMSRELELKRQEAERATRAKSDFLAAMSHEIRTPLNAIIGMADVLSESSLTTDQQKCVDVFQRNGLSLLTLINDILDLAKVVSGKIELEAAALDLRDVIARAMEVIEGRASAKGLELHRVIEPGVPYHLIGDANRLRQIIINLLGNAIKFTERGRLSVRVEPDPDDRRPGRLRFGVSDTGIGIPADKLAAVFESFTQADSSTTRKYGGTGLGLAISKQLVELMDGRIWVESQVGVGSTFYFTASLGVDTDQSERKPAEQAKSSIAELERMADGLRILLADDAADNRFLILSYLKGVRCSIDIAEDGDAAAKMFRSGHYDVVLMDVEMPVADGYMATRAIRQYERQTGATPAPVLALTAHAFADMAVKSAEAGFTAHLTKPIRKATLLAALAQHAGRGSRAILEEPAVPPVPDPLRILVEPIRVLVEEDMADVVPSYLEKRRNEVPTYRQVLANGDFKTLRLMGHRMKGTGAGYGFAMLTDFGGAIEMAALNSDARSIGTTLDELSRYLDNVKLEYI
ncbi:MAG: ATP-binding protein, partial [Bryobacteraceae bacterium]